MIPDTDRRMVSPKPAPSSSVAVTGFVLVAIAGLYLGQGIFVPLVLAILFAFTLDPVVGLLRRLRLPRIVAVIIAVVAVATLLVLIGYLVVTQLLTLAADLPQYQQTVAKKLRALQETAGGDGVWDRLAGLVERLGNEVAAQTGSADNIKPVPVIVTNAAPVPIAGIQGLLGALIGPLATAAIVTIFAIFLLLEREDLRDRFLKLVSRGDLRTSTQVINESAARVSRYLLVQFGVNAGYGIVFGAALTLLNVPNAILWGLLAALFRYIPFVGTIIAVAFPAAIAFAVDPGWGMLAGVLALYFVMEMITTNAIEPRLYGSSTGLSALAVLVAAIFWATLWGPIGLILATPVTVCLVVLGRYVPQLGFLETLLGSEPVLAPEEKLYQRLLAGNVEEAVELAEAEVEEQGAVEFYDRVVVPALRLAEADLHTAHADLGIRRLVAESVSGIIRDLSDGAAAQDESPTPSDEAEPRVLSLGGKTELDGAAADLVVHASRLAGLAATMMPPMAVRPESLGQLELTSVEAVCLCYLGSRPQSYARYVATRLKRRHPKLRIIACLLGANGTAQTTEPGELRVDAIATSIAGTQKLLRDWLELEQAGAPAAPGPVISADTTPEAVRKIKALAVSEGWLEQRCVEIAKAFEVPLALATVTDLSTDGTGDRPGNAITEHIVTSGSRLVIEAVAKDKVFSDSPFLLENGIQFYAGEPLVTSGGEVIGALSLVDVVPRAFTPAEAERLTQTAADLMVEFEGRQKRPPPRTVAKPKARAKA